MSRINIWQDYFARQGIKRLTDISPDLVDSYVNSVLSGRKPKTRKNHLFILKTMLNYAIKWELIESNPIAKVKPPKIIKMFRSFDKKDMRQILKDADEPLKTEIIILVSTGLRRSELYNLR